MSRVEVIWDETGQQVLKSFKSHSTRETAHLYLHESRSRCEIKLWLQWFEVQAQACCAALCSEGSLHSWIDCWSYTDATVLASPHKHFIMRQVKLSSSTHCGPKQKWVWCSRATVECCLKMEWKKRNDSFLDLLRVTVLTTEPPCRPNKVQNY